MKMTVHEKVNKAKEQHIYVQEEIIDRFSQGRSIRGVYGFYAIKDQEEIPFYIGKAVCICDRIFGSNNGHVHKYFAGCRNTDVQKQMQRYLEKGYNIEVRVLKEVPYEGDCFNKNANKLALAELKEIVDQQEKGFCLDIRSEAVKRDEVKNFDKWVEKNRQSS